MVQCEGVLVGILISPLEIGARIMVNVVGTLEEWSIKVGLAIGSSEEKRSCCLLVVFAKWWEILVDLFHTIQQQGTIII